MKKNIVVQIICALFIMLFVYAAVSKLLDFQKFTVELQKSPVFTSYAWLVAICVPAIELLVAAMLVITRVQMIALYASFSLMVMFTTYIVIILNFSDYVPCSCGGVLQNLSWGQHLVFNIAFVVLAVTAILLFPKKQTGETIPAAGINF